MAQREKPLFKENWLEALMEARKQDAGELSPRQLEEVRQREDDITMFAEEYLVRTMHDVVEEMKRENDKRQEARQNKAALAATTAETRTVSCQQLLLVAAKHEKEDRERWMTESADKNINTV